MSVSCFSHRKSIGITFHKYFKKIRLWLNALVQRNYYIFVKSHLGHYIIYQISVILHCNIII